MAEERGPIRFGVFEADLMSHTLRKRGAHVRLQELPFRLLAMLLARPGEVVTREELKNELWAEEDYGEFDLGLNTAVKKLRQALDDSANTPRFVETIPKVGYRFIGSVAGPTPHEDAGEPLPLDVVVLSKRRVQVLHARAAVLGIALLAGLALHFTQMPPAAPEQPVRRFSFVPPPDLNTSPLYAGLAISPNGRHLAFTTAPPHSSLWVQDLDQDEPRRLAGTDGAYLPFWSPDSEYIVFAAGNELRKISVQGGARGLVCNLPGPMFYQGTWSPDGESIIFASTRGSLPSSIFEAPSQGGSPKEIIIAADVGEIAGLASRPEFVPAANDRVLVFTVGDDAASKMYAKNLDSGQTAALGAGDRPIYSAATGHLIYQSGRNVYDLWARAFSPETLQFTGPAIPVRQNARQPSLSDDGTLAYLDGVSAGSAQTLAWRNRKGELVETVGQPQPTKGTPALSPDGRRVALVSAESGNLDIWVHDLIRSTKTRLTFDAGPERGPAWSPSGDEIVYWLQGADGSSLVRQAADGTGDAVVMVEAKVNLPNPDWSRDGRYLVYQENTSSATGADIRYLEA